jgi:hypothetical protein
MVATSRIRRPPTLNVCFIGAKGASHRRPQRQRGLGHVCARCKIAGPDTRLAASKSDMKD